MKITDDRLFAACKAFSESEAVYPDGTAATQITDWFKLDAQDAVDFGVMQVPKWDGQSDLRGTQHEWYVAAVIKEPMRSALAAALAVQTQQGVDGLTKTQIETLANNIHNVNDYDYTVECLTYHCSPRSALIDVPAVESEPVAFASRHNDETGECEPVSVEPAKVRELRERVAARKEYDAALESLNRATDQEIAEAAKRYVDAVNGGPGARGSNKAWRSYDKEKQATFDALRLALSTRKGSAEGDGAAISASGTGGGE